MLLDKLMCLSLTVGCGVYTGLLGASLVARVVALASAWACSAKAVLAW
jgi:hypothetical protein